MMVIDLAEKFNPKKAKRDTITKINHYILSENDSLKISKICDVTFEGIFDLNSVCTTKNGCEHTP
jgi:hypothetical protein